MPITDRSDSLNAKPKLRVAYLADLNPYARSLLRLRALLSRGSEVCTIATSPPAVNRASYQRPAFWEYIIRKLGWFPDVTHAMYSLLEITRSKPLDLIWIDRGLTIKVEALRQAKILSGAKAVCFSEDDMALPHNHSRRWLAALPEYDLVVTTKIANIQHRDLELLGARSVLYVTQSYDPEQHYPVPMDALDQANFASEISFIGWFEKEREQSILALAKAGLSVRVWGPGWGGKLKHSNVQVQAHEILNTDRTLNYSKALTASKICLGFLRKLNRDQHTSRSVEIPACGSMLLAERTPVHQAMFAEGVEAEFFADDEELIAKARYYLEHEDARRKIAQAGHDRTVREYSSARQMNQILQALGLAEP